MNPIIQNILWCAAGIVGILIIAKVARKPKIGDEPTLPPPPPEPTPVSAKEAFLWNIDKFSLILPQLNSTLNIESWTEQIVDINNPQLIALWERCLKNAGVWKQMLSSWGLRQDTCKSFTYLEKYSNMYETADKSEPKDGCKYRVIDACWILTDETSGKKRVVKKGIIEIL